MNICRQQTVARLGTWVRLEAQDPWCDVGFGGCDRLQRLPRLLSGSGGHSSKKSPPITKRRYEQSNHWVFVSPPGWYDRSILEIPETWESYADWARANYPGPELLQQQICLLVVLLNIRSVGMINADIHYSPKIILYFRLNCNIFPT